MSTKNLSVNFFARLLATTFFSGNIKFAPGTIGALISLIVYWLAPPISWLPYLISLLILFFIGVWASTIAEQDYGHDARKITVDEVAGMLVSWFALPKIGWLAIAGFILFRFFDIAKPFPINWLQKTLSAGWGIMADDLLAGIFTNIILQIIVMIFGLTSNLT